MQKSEAFTLYRLLLLSKTTGVKHLMFILELRLYRAQPRELAKLILDIWYSYCKVLSHFSFCCLVRYLVHIISCLAPSWYFHIHSSQQLVCVMVCNVIFGQRDFLSFRGNRNVFWLILKVSIDYFILGKFQWTMCIFKVFKDFWQYYPQKGSTLR